MKQKQHLTISIENNIPIPERRTRGRERIYPVESLEVGQSFLMPECKYFSSAHSLATRTKIKYPDREFTCRRVGDGIRVWRIK